MRTTRVLAFALLMACSSKAAPPPAAPVAAKPDVPADAALFPMTAQTLLEAESATEPTQVEKLARTALKQLDEERALSSGNDAAYARIATRARIAIDGALMAQGKSMDVLADLAAKALVCPPTPKRLQATCQELMASLATALPNAVTAKGTIAEVDAHVIDEATTDVALTAFAKKVGAQVGIVVQRVHVGAKIKDALEIGGAVKLRFHATPADIKRVAVEDGEIVWLAFDAHSLKKAGALWDGGKAHVLTVQHANRAVSGL